MLCCIQQMDAAMLVEDCVDAARGKSWMPRDHTLFVHDEWICITVIDNVAPRRRAALVQMQVLGLESPMHHCGPADIPIYAKQHVS